MTGLDPAISSVLAAKEAATQSQISFAVAKKGLDAQEQQGQAVVSLIEAAGRIGKETGKGASFDAFG
ncbi:YjfB family protein [Blastopirellula sp. JC732]|uniref:YjfB family protein n=1 Tax=Blastopirellula sediminis TaxID=2894196 RepID=A0A9X1MRJ0_9BACT|nr:putative motility protein [Blastopirellula sediminis]MCC9605605.1 YjfB family protein [Blastopirellula sediminis]MCC9631095.1 YjfB family protein [Blastopirellula sediminis]